MRHAATAVLIACAFNCAASAQGDAKDPSPNAPAGVSAENAVPRTDDPRFEEYRANRKRLVELERTLNGVRARHFGPIRHEGKRAEGVEKMIDTLQTFDHPSSYPVAVKVFDREGTDVRAALLGFFESERTPEADASIAWLACLGRDEALRTMARETLVRRADAAGGELCHEAKFVIDQALRAYDEKTVVAAARTVHALHLFEAIPLLIMAQVQTAAQAARAGDEGVRAWIFVGTQRSYIYDVTPVIGARSVAFDPQIAVLNTGTLLVVGDSLVTTYRTEVNSVLIAMTSEAWGRPTEYLGFDLVAWREWHAMEFLPHLERKRAEQNAQAPATAQD